MVTLDLRALDRDVARAYRAVTRSRAVLEDSPDAGVQDPLLSFRHVAGREAFEELRAYPAGLIDESLRRGLLSWVYALTQARVGFETELSWARAAAETRGLVVLEATEETSYRDSWRGAMRARDLATRSAWLEACAGLAPGLSSITREAAARRVEVAKRLGFASLHEARGGVDAARLGEAARQLLARTSELRASLRRESGQAIDATPSARLAGWIGVAFATDAREGWPARLSLRWLDETFPELTRGVVERPLLPQVTGAASFARALYALGRAAREGGRSSLPFAIARAPSWVDPHSFGFVVGALASQRIFHRTLLGLGERAAHAQARALARTALFEAALTAARWLLTEGGGSGKPMERWEEVTFDVFGGRIDPRFSGAWPRGGGDEGPRLEGLLAAPSLASFLVSRFDVDWFKNPRAGEWIRARAGGPAVLPVEPGEPAADPVLDASRLASLFEEALG